MMDERQSRKKGEKIKAGVTILGFIIAMWEVMSSLNLEAVSLVTDGLFVIFLYAAVKEYKKEDISVKKMILTLAGAYLSTCIGLISFKAVVDRGIKLFVFLMLPGLIIFIASRKLHRPINGRKLLKCWLLCDVVIWFWSLYVIPSVWRYFWYTNWRNVLQICLPMVCAVVFRKYKKNTAVGYFGTCLLISIITENIFRFVCEMAPSIIGSIYYIVVCLIVYVLELRYRNEKSENGMIQVLSGVLYVIISVLILFWQNPRVREIFYHLTGTACYIDVSKREDWLGYRLSALKYMLNDMENVIFVSVFAVLIVFLVCLLLKKNRTNTERYHAAKLLSVSYLVRTGMYILPAFGGFSFDHIMKMPFTSYFVVDAAVLGLFIWEMKRKAVK